MNILYENKPIKESYINKSLSDIKESKSLTEDFDED